VDYRDRIVGRQVIMQVARLMKYRVVYEFAEFLLDAVQTTHVVPRDRRHLDQVLTHHARVTVRQRTLQHSPTLLAYTPDTMQYNAEFVKRHVAVASEAPANRTVKKQRRRRTNVL